MVATHNKTSGRRRARPLVSVLRRRLGGPEWPRYRGWTQVWPVASVKLPPLSDPMANTR